MVGEVLAVGAGLAVGWGLVMLTARRAAVTADAGGAGAGSAGRSRRERGVEAVTWLIIVGVTISGVLGAAVLYNTVLSDQGDRIQQQEIPCVRYDTAATGMTSGTLGTDGGCT